MQITINEEEIMEAIYDYCAKQITLPVGSEYSVEFVAGRAPAGPRAIIDIVTKTTRPGNNTRVTVKEEAPDKTPDKVVEETTNEKPGTSPEIAQVLDAAGIPFDDGRQDAEEEELPGEGSAEDLTGKQPGAAGVTLIEGKSLFDL